MSECREAFEKWWNNRSLSLQKYEAAFDSWQAAWNARTPKPVDIERGYMAIIEAMGRDESATPEDMAKVCAEAWGLPIAEPSKSAE